MLLKELIYTVDLPEGVTVSMDNHDVKLSGPRGDLNRIFKHPLISLSEDNGSLKLVGKKIRRKEKALIGTWRAHLRNMIQGVSTGFLYEMKIVFAHFPMKVSVKGNIVHRFKEKPQTKQSWINGGFFVFEPEFLRLIKSSSTVLEEEPLENLAKRKQLIAFKHEKFWQCMDTKRDKDLLERLWNEKKTPWKCW